MTDNAATLRDLDIAIARRLGYTVETRQFGGMNGYVLVMPDGTRVSTNWWHEAEDAWNEAPYYSTNANAALSLIAGLPFVLQHRRVDNFAVYHAYVDGERATASTPAEAIARAWLRRQRGDAGA